MTDEPIVIKNLKYWGAPRNDGFVLMPNEVEAYRVPASKAFEFKGTNGFMITFDITSEDVAKAAGAAKGDHRSGPLKNPPKRVCQRSLLPPKQSQLR